MRAVPGILLLSGLTAVACTAEFMARSGTDAPVGAAGGGGDAAGARADAGDGTGTDGGRAGAGTAGGSEGGSPPEPAGGAATAGAAPVAGSGAGPVAIPTDGLVLWLRADEGVSHTAGVVTLWQDSSPYRVEAEQSATNYRPKLVPNTLGGKSAVVFDGIDDYLKLPELDADFSGGVSIVYAGAQTLARECDAVFEASNGLEADDLHLGRWKGFPLYEVSSDYLHAVDYPFVPGEPEVLMGIHRANGTVSLRRNTFGLGETVFATPSATKRSDVFLGRTLYAGCTPFTGAIGELLVYARALDDNEIVELEEYLQQKWSCCRE